MAQHEHLSPTQALARAQQLEALVRNRSRWYVRYLVVFGGVTLVMVLTLGFTSGPLMTMTSMAVWVTFVVVSSIYVARQPVFRRGYGTRHTMIMVAWGVLYAGVLLGGQGWFQGELAWWLPGAVLVSLPPFVGAYLESR